MKKAFWLNRAFLASTLLFCSPRTEAQSGITGNHVSGSVLRAESNAFYKHFYADAAVKAHAKAAAPDTKTGILIVNGGEHPAGKNYSSNKMQKNLNTLEMIEALKNNIVRVVGSPDYGTDADSVVAALIEIGKEVTDNIFLFVDMHGIDERSYMHSGRKEDKGVFFARNALQIGNGNYSENNYADSLYAKIGRAFETAPELKGKKLIVAHLACHGASADEALTQLPPGTTAMVFSGPKENTWGLGFSTPMIKPFKDNPHLVADAENLVAASILYANTGMDQDSIHQRNNIKIITVHKGPTDTVPDNSSGQRRLIYNQNGHRATMTDPLSDMTRLQWQNIPKPQLSASLDRHFGLFLNGAEQQEILQAFQETKTLPQLNKLTLNLRDGIFALSCAYMADHPTVQRSVVRNSITYGIKGVDPGIARETPISRSSRSWTDSPF